MSFHCWLFRSEPGRPTLRGMNRTLYRFALSGHCHRVELLLSFLGLDARWVDVDLTRQQQKTPEFLAKNPFGQVPVLQEDDVVIADSNAILVYLVRRYAPEQHWLPKDPFEEAQVQRWLSLAAGPLAAGAATARAAAVFMRPGDTEPMRAIARRLFATMNDHLATRPFLVNDTPTLADIAMYSYTAHAPEGGVALAPYPHLQRWLKRIEALPRFKPMPRTETPELASAQ